MVCILFYRSISQYRRRGTAPPLRTKNAPPGIWVVRIVLQYRFVDVFNCFAEVLFIEGGGNLF